MFSSRTPADLSPNEITLTLARKRRAGARILDLTESNPTRAGFDYPRELIGAALGNPRGLRYDPDPRGLATAREAVANYYRVRGVEVPVERIVLTASTSEAYSLIFKLLANADDEVMVPAPSYPLFEHLARVECVRPVTYQLAWDGAWRIDLEALCDATTPRTRAIVVVSPNNPTGSTLKQYELLELVRICHKRGLALVADEVFADYAYEPDPRRAPSVAACDEVLTFALNGLSKVAGLPQLKLGWIVVNGPEDVADQAVARLEFLADLFLSVGTPVQRALPELLELAAGIRQQIRDRIARNRATLAEEVTADGPSSVLPSEAGWYALVRVPRLVPDEQLALDLLERHDTLIQPGYFFDIAMEGIVVVSLLTEPDVFREGVRQVLAYLNKPGG